MILCSKNYPLMLEEFITTIGRVNMYMYMYIPFVCCYYFFSLNMHDGYPLVGFPFYNCKCRTVCRFLFG